MKVISVYPNFQNVGGAQNVTLQLAQHLNREHLPIVLTSTPLDKINKQYSNLYDFRHFSFFNVKELISDDVVFLSHSRYYTTLLMLFRVAIGKRLHVIHVAHSTFSNLKRLTILPQDIIAVSNGVKQNLIEYFKIVPSNINVIFNGLHDISNNGNYVKKDDNSISILVLGRICSVKQQVKMVQMTKGKLSHNIHIYFAGVGEEEELLQKEIKDNINYHYLGQIDISTNLNKYDYLCSFSQKEGLPLSLIEGLMFGKPLVTNRLPSVLDVNIEGYTGFTFKNFEDMPSVLNALPETKSDTYKKMSLQSRERFEMFFTENSMIKSYQEYICNYFRNKIK